MSHEQQATERATAARHARVGSRHPLARLFTIIGVVLAVALVSGAGVAGFALWNAADTIASKSVELGDEELLPPSMGAIEGDVTMLLVGTDSCDGQDIALFPRCAEDDGGERNDVTMLVRISDNPRRVTVVSIPRDMLVSLPACPKDGGGQWPAESSAMMNASYTHGGLPCSVLTVEKLTGVDIQYAAAVRWTGVINLSDAVGGVDVCVQGDIDDGHTGLHLTAGTHTLQGAEALQFLRIRHGIGDGSDLGRISNQQQFMSSLVRKLQSDEVLTNPTTLFTFASVAMQQVSSGQLVLSQGLANPTRMVQIAMALKSVPFEDFVFVQYPTTYTSDFTRVLPVREDAEALFAALAENKALHLTGEASQGSGVDVQGDATPLPPVTPSPTPGVTGEPAPVIDEAVELPDSISGTTAAQITCTRPEG